ncbi:hypothetical protein [Mammaliicoccus sp. P-M59]|uniref:phage lytic cycle repressor MrpR family protein n=1 Tax=Mammaliicoccus sp. P-M59 TaxID=2898718 RepID=UPI001EFA4F5B|nr:hypothetical protein [Mammaliicoccus sp. P-M59]
MYFNHFYKEQFMQSIQQESTSTIANYVSLFNKSKILEETFDKDLYNFDTSEIELLLYSFNSPSKNTLNTYLNQCKRYADYAISHGHRVSNINLFKSFTYDSLKRYVNVYKQKYYSIDDINEMLKDVYNIGDKALYMAIFEGIAGYMYSEISNIKEEDIKKARNNINEDGKHVLSVKGIGKNTGELRLRDIAISKQLLDDLFKTYESVEYYKNNGESKAKATKIEIAQGDYVFRNTLRSEDNEPQVNKQYVYRKLRLLKTITEDKISSVTTLINSGIIYHLSLLADDNNVIGLNQAKEVHERYDFTPNAVSPKSSYRTFVRKHEDALYNIYGVKFEE